MLHVLADDEQVVLPLVHGLELLDRLARAGMNDPEIAAWRADRLDDGGDGAEVEIVVANVERGGVNERHAAPRTFPGTSTV